MGGQARRGQARTGEDRRGEDRRGQARTGEDRRGQARRGQTKSPRREAGGRDRGGRASALDHFKRMERIHSGCNLPHWTLSPERTNLGQAVIRLQDNRLGGKAEGLGQILGGLGGLGGGGGGDPLVLQNGGEGGEGGGGDSLLTHSFEQLNRLPGTPRRGSLQPQRQGDNGQLPFVCQI